MAVDEQREAIQEGSTVHDTLMKLLDGAGVCVLVAAGENGRVISGNSRSYRFLGMTPEDLLGSPVEGALAAYYEEGLKVHRDLVEENGVVFQVFSFSAGENELRKELEKSSAFFRQVVESVPDAVVTVDRNGLVTGWNREAVKLFGWSVEEALGKPLDDLVTTDTGRNEINSLSVIQGQVIRGMECTRRGRDSVEKKVFVSVAPIVTNGETRGAVGVYTDLSHRETILEKLRENEIKFRSITDSAQDAVIIMDDQGYVSFFNSSAERMFGYSRAETMGKQLHRLIAPDTYWDMFEAGFTEFRKTGEGIVIGRVLEMEGRRKNGTVFPVELSVSSFFMHGGWHATGILRDITERKRIELELIEAREGALNAARTKSEFLANMSHEIRTPLNAILGTTDLLWETDIDPRQRSYLKVSRNAGENLLSLINDILDISKVDAGRVELEAIPFDLIKNIEKTCETLALRAHEKGLELNCRIVPGTPEWVIGDPSRLRQILMNLIGNAIKFTEKGDITVTAERDEGDTMRISVRDTGMGIPEGKLESIFMSFTQADSSHTRRFGGTGLGLTICRKLVELMDGSITVSSELGKGSEFTFTCRMPETRPERTEPPDDPSLEGVRVLLVDDSDENRTILTELLELWKVSVTAAESVSQAICEVEKDSFQAVLLDCSMKDSDGFQAAELLRRAGVKPDTVIMMLTSRKTGAHEEMCSAAGISRYMVKPLRRGELKRQLFGILRGESPEGHTFRPIEQKPRPIEDRMLRILLAEDSPDNRFLILKYLESYPWEISVAENGKEALELYDSGSFDIILMDMQMPVMDGYEATRAIRSREAMQQGTHTPVVALTAHAMKEEIEKCLNAGCDIHLSKPVRKAKLIAELDGLISATGAREGTPEIAPEVPGAAGEVAHVPEDLKTLIPGYMENRRRDIETIGKLLEEKNFDEARRLAHSMKGSGGGYGFDRITELGALMERAAKELDASGVLDGLEKLKNFIDTVKIEYVEE